MKSCFLDSIKLVDFNGSLYFMDKRLTTEVEGFKYSSSLFLKVFHLQSYFTLTVFKSTEVEGFRTCRRRQISSACLLSKQTCFEYHVIDS